MTNWQGRVAVVTGAASGIGYALAREMASHGLRVVLADVRLGALAEAREQLHAEFPGLQTLASECDVSRASDLEELAQYVYELWGRVDVVCNNAGVFPTLLPVWEQELSEWERLWRINTMGLIHGIRAFVPRMVEQGDDCWVVNTVSLAGLITAPYVGPYYASKQAAMAISECLEFELRAVDSPIKVVTINPGWVNTSLLDARPGTGLDKQTRREEARDLKIRELVESAITPEEVARHAWEAMQEGKFYVFPEPERLAEFEKRAQVILGGDNPKWPR